MAKDESTKVCSKPQANTGHAIWRAAHVTHVIVRPPGTRIEARQHDGPRMLQGIRTCGCTAYHDRIRCSRRRRVQRPTESISPTMHNNAQRGGVERLVVQSASRIKHAAEVTSYFYVHGPSQLGADTSSKVESSTKTWQRLVVVSAVVARAGLEVSLGDRQVDERRSGVARDVHVFLGAPRAKKRRWRKREDLRSSTPSKHRHSCSPGRVAWSQASGIKTIGLLTRRDWTSNRCIGCLRGLALPSS